jgi:tetratricopeptide (TPR) repeat protein
MKSHPFHRIIEALLVVPVAICAQSFARAESTEQTVKDEIQVGIEAYQHHDFQTALKYLTLGEHAEPQNALIHYYRANSLASLKQIKKALPEYQAALKLDPKGDVGFYSEQALKNAKQTTASGPLQGTVNAQGFQTYSTPTARSYAQPIPGSAATGVWSPSSGSSAGIQIMQQSRDLSRQVVDAGAINEANIIGSGLSRTAIMRQQMQAQVMRMRNAVAPSLNGGYVHMYSAGEIQAYQQRMQMQINAAMQNESYEASNQHKLLQQQAEAVNQSAANLQSQLNAPYVPGQPHLSSVGTNLYVRSYEDVGLTPTAGTVPALEAAAAPAGEHAQALSLSTLQAQDRALLSPQHRLTTN